jgi:hypothetical protein
MVGGMSGQKIKYSPGFIPSAQLAKYFYVVIKKYCCTEYHVVSLELGRYFLGVISILQPRVWFFNLSTLYFLFVAIFFCFIPDCFN